MNFNINIYSQGGKTYIKTDGCNIQIATNQHIEYQENSSDTMSSFDSMTSESQEDSWQESHDTQEEADLCDFEAFPLEYFKKDHPDKSCSICITDYKLQDLIRRLPCMHYFHQACCDEWLQRVMQCPVCR